MADSGLVKMSDQFGGLPMDQLIGGPLKAACSAQTLLAKASADFIKDVGLDTDATGKVMSARTVDFSFNKPVQDADGTTKMEKVDLQVTPHLLLLAKLRMVSQTNYHSSCHPLPKPKVIPTKEKS